MNNGNAGATAPDRRFEAKPAPGGVRTVLLVCFWLWGLFYGLYTLALVANANAMSSLGVGTSAAVSMNALFWIGGLLLFGLGAIAVRPTYEVRLIETKS